MFLISHSLKPARTLIQKPELQMRVISSPLRLMDVQYNGDEGITRSPVCVEMGKGTAVVELQMLVGILHQSEQLLFAKQEFLSPGCTWQCRNFSPSCLPFSFAPRSAAELAPAFQLFSFFFSPLSRARLLLSAAVGRSVWEAVRRLLMAIDGAPDSALFSANAVWGKVGFELLKGNGLMWYSPLAENLLVGRRNKQPF